MTTTDRWVPRQRVVRGRGHGPEADAWQREFDQFLDLVDGPDLDLCREAVAQHLRIHLGLGGQHEPGAGQEGGVGHQCDSKTELALLDGDGDGPLHVLPAQVLAQPID